MQAPAVLALGAGVEPSARRLDALAQARQAEPRSGAGQVRRELIPTRIAQLDLERAASTATRSLTSEPGACFIAFVTPSWTTR